VEATSPREAPIPYERFSESLRRALVIADYEARFLVTGAIESGHLLFGVVQEATEEMSELSRGRLTPPSLRRQLKEEWRSRLQPGPSDETEMRLSEEAALLLHRTDEEARALGSMISEPLHFILAALRDETSLPAKLLTEADVTIASVRARLAAASREAAGGTVTGEPLGR
jgi:ATP-dependent Clp protease ATP-binding subunit ClpA